MIKSIDRAGRVTGYFGVVQGTLIGKGDLTGNIDENGILRLSGTFSPWQIVITARINGDTIQANYRLTGPDTQNGVFTVTLAADVNEQPIKPNDRPPVPRDPPPTPQNTATVCTKLEGTAYNNKYHQAGNVTFDLVSNEPDGNVAVKFRAFNGLQGEGTLVGKIDSDGVVRFRGNVSGSTMETELRANADGSITGTYTLTTGGATQDGTISVKCTKSTTANPTPPIKPPPFQPPANPKPKTGNFGNINGSWKGTYICAQGLTNVVLSLFTKDGANVDGVFTALLGDGPDMRFLGSFKMVGSYRAETGKIDLRGVDWDTKPAEFELVDLSGNVTQPERNLSGRIIHAGCSTFQLEKIRF